EPAVRERPSAACIPASTAPHDGAGEAAPCALLRPTVLHWSRRSPSLQAGMLFPIIVRHRGQLVTACLALVLSGGTARGCHNEECFAAADAAQALRDQGKYTQARDHFAACSAPVCPAIVRRDCSRWLDELMQAWPTIVVSAEDLSGVDVADVHLFVDGALVA